MREILRELPAIPRAVLLLREFEELSYEEVARVLGLEVGTVKSRLHRARRQFAILYEQRERGSSK